jgi:hypothetical protein
VTAPRRLRARGAADCDALGQRAIEDGGVVHQEIPSHRSRSAGSPHRTELRPDACPFILGDRTGRATDAEREDPLAGDARNLDELVEIGASEKTPLILLGRVWIVTTAAALVILALALLAYRLAS